MKTEIVKVWEKRGLGYVMLALVLLCAFLVIGTMTGIIPLEGITIFATFLGYTSFLLIWWEIFNGRVS